MSLSGMENGPAGFTASSWSCSGASATGANSVTLSPGDNAICTITNTAVAPKLTLKKVVVNANGSTLAIPQRISDYAFKAIYRGP